VSAEEWLFPPGTFDVPAEAFIGVHPGAGTSTWAALLEGADHGLLMPGQRVVTAVCRATPAALNGAKALVKEHGVARFRAFLVVADAPGRALPAAAREIKVLSSVVPSVAAAIAKPVQRVRDRLADAHIRVPRGFVEIEKGNTE
jgi:hypothetical protein